MQDHSSSAKISFTGKISRNNNYNNEKKMKNSRWEIKNWLVLYLQPCSFDQDSVENLVYESCL